MDSVTLEYSLTTEAKSLIHTIFGVSNGFYIKNGWQVLPYKKPYSESSPSVYLPRLDYIGILGSYINVSESDRVTNLSDSAQSNKEWVNKISKAIEKNHYKEIGKGEREILEKEYKKLLIPAVKKIKSSISFYKSKNFTVTITPTDFGTGLSFTVLRGEKLLSKNLDIHIKIRKDAPTYLVLEGLASAISRGLYERDVKTAMWRETESISDFITKYLLDCKKFTPTLSKVANIDKKLLEESLTYLISIKAPTGVPFKYIESTNSIMLFEDNITPNFTPYEFKALRVLLKNRNRTVSFDQISEELYGDETDIKFTIWGITKTIQRVRDKLQIYGLPRDLICNVKGQGFKLLS